MSCRLFILIVGTAFLYSCAPSLPDDVETAYNMLPKKVEFNKHVKPILSDKCFACHGPDKASQKAGLRLDIADAAYAELPETPGKRAIVPGSLRKSELFKRIITDDPDLIMPDPSSHLTLSAHEKAVLVKWIEDGAEYKPHWAFIKPEEHEIPDVADEDRVVNPIDNFIINRLEQENLSLSPEADKAILLRRVSLDLTGLPPTIAETEDFLKDKSANAYEKQVDRLMASPHYGERIAVDWLDAAATPIRTGIPSIRLETCRPGAIG
ncbi:DUF1549 domain-containing protein [Niabella ginsengisoli]|uniref:DUF1549 domain-containing protein n=1 Tax=Niabella ginsengisoli TaxID=522298 RepID=A0ABS9SGL5_9BACT|nr:DUF1549 domain-containing protein [Niabella ginsengisoli]MCH5597497.1 DUF1549 domain-containing protein [Niabella ginsengisoli]